MNNSTSTLRRQSRPTIRIPWILIVVVVLVVCVISFLVMKNLSKAPTLPPTSQPTVQPTSQPTATTAPTETPVPTLIPFLLKAQIRDFVPFSFTDITENIPGRTWIDFASAHGYLEPCTPETVVALGGEPPQEGEVFFCPKASITRGEVAKAMVLYTLDITPVARILDAFKAPDLQAVLAERGSPLTAETILGELNKGELPPYAAIFKDVPENHPYRPWIELFYYLGKVAGCKCADPVPDIHGCKNPGPTNYCPNWPVSMAELAVMKARVLELSGREYVPQEEYLGIFEDVPDNGSWWVKWAENDATTDLFPLLGAQPYQYHPFYNPTKADFAFWLWFLEARRVMEDRNVFAPIPSVTTPSP